MQRRVSERLKITVAVVAISVIVAVAVQPLAWFIYDYGNWFWMEVSAYKNLLNFLSLFVVALGAAGGWLLSGRKVVEGTEIYVSDEKRNPDRKKLDDDEVRVRKLRERIREEIPTMERRNLDENEEAIVVEEKQEIEERVVSEKPKFDLETSKDGTFTLKIKDERKGGEGNRKPRSEAEVSKMNKNRLNDAMTDRVIKDLDSGYLHVIPDKATLKKLGIEGDVKVVKDETGENNKKPNKVDIKKLNLPETAEDEPKGEPDLSREV